MNKITMKEDDIIPHTSTELPDDTFGSALGTITITAQTTVLSITHTSPERTSKP